MTQPRFNTITVAEARITALRPIRTAAEQVLGRLWKDELPRRLTGGDHALWGLPEDAPDCLPASPGPARDLLPDITALAGRLSAAGVTEVLLIGSGATPRAAEVITRSGGGTLTVFDGLDPGPLVRLANDRARLRRSAVVLTSGDPVSDVLMRTVLAAYEQAGLTAEETAERCVVVAEPGSAPAVRAGQAGHTLIPTGPHPVFGALSTPALVPAALAGADVEAVLQQAMTFHEALGSPGRNPGLVLGAIVGGCARAGRRTVVLGQYTCPVFGLGAWIGRLLSGATEGRILPVVQYGGLPVLPADDIFLVSLEGGRPAQDDVTVSGPLGVQLAMWEYAAAVAAYLLGTDPFARAGGQVAAAVREPLKAVVRAAGEADDIGAAGETDETAGTGEAALDGGWAGGEQNPAAGEEHDTAAAVDRGAAAGSAAIAGTGPATGPQARAAEGLRFGSPGRPDGMDRTGRWVQAEPAARAASGDDLGTHAGVPAPASPASAPSGSAPAGSAVVIPEEEVVTGFETPADVLDRLIAILPSDGGLSVIAFLDPEESAGQAWRLRRLAAALAARCGRPVTADLGFVNHSREKDVYLVLTGNVVRDAPVPGGGRTLGSLQLAQAQATVRVLRERGRPVARLHVVHRGTGMDQLLEAAQGGA